MEVEKERGKPLGHPRMMFVDEKRQTSTPLSEV